MMENSPYRNISKLGIDTISKTIRKTSIYNYIDKHHFTIKEVKSNTRISANAKRSLFTKEVTSLYQVKTAGGFKNMIVSTPHKLNQKKDYKFFLLTAYGLNQYIKPLDQNQREEIQSLFNRYKPDSIDLSIDTSFPIDKSLLSHFGGITPFYSTIYVNNPPQLKDITKICYYLKHFKDDLEQPLYRTELRMKVAGKLNELQINKKEVLQVANTLYLNIEDNQLNKLGVM